MILVTGANGFVGCALCHALVEAGHRVRKSIRAVYPAASVPTHDMAGKAAQTVAVGDIGPDTDWASALKGVHAIVHLAARVHVMNDISENPLAAFRRVNTAGTERLARAAAAFGVRRMIFVSSVKVNGERTSGPPFTENDMPRPEDPYGISKWEAEQLLHRVAEETGLETIVLRPPLLYGPGVKGNFLRLLRLIDASVPLPLANVDNRRSLLYLGNLVDAIIQCIAHPAAAGQTFLVSDGEETSTPELIRHLAHALGKRARLFTAPPGLLRLAGRAVGRGDKVARLLDSLVMDSSKICRDLGWQPPYSMARGLKETAAWYRSTRYSR